MQFLDEAARGIYGPSAIGIDGSSPIAVAVSALLTSRGGKEFGEGLRQLIDRFTHCGHGAIAQSWVDTGSNQPVTPNQLEDALGPATIHALARQSGLPSQELLLELSRHLPGIVDKLTRSVRCRTHPRRINPENHEDTMQTIKDLLIEEMRDTYSSETQILEGLGAMADAATSPNLKQAFQTHRQETANQVERLKQAFEHLGADPEGNTCEATQGLIAEAEEVMEEGLPGELLDVALVMAAQKVEHYEIASYGSLKTIAQDCGESAVAALLGQTLAEEKATDEKLTRLAETEINKTAIAAAPSA